MGALPQLFMRRPELLVPPLALPEGFSLHSHIRGKEAVWEDMVERAFGTHFSFEELIGSRASYKPEYVLYIAKDGVDIATTAAIEKDIFPGEGYFHMVATVPEARGLGAGRLVAIAALHSLWARGLRTTVLSTDDFRLPAIKLYLSLGFEPMYSHESHEGRWRAVMEKLTMK